MRKNNKPEQNSILRRFGFAGGSFNGVMTSLLKKPEVRD